MPASSPHKPDEDPNLAFRAGAAAPFVKLMRDVSRGIDQAAATELVELLMRESVQTNAAAMRVAHRHLAAMLNKARSESMPAKDIQNAAADALTVALRFLRFLQPRAWRTLLERPAGDDLGLCARGLLEGSVNVAVTGNIELMVSVLGKTGVLEASIEQIDAFADRFLTLSDTLDSWIEVVKRNETVPVETLVDFTGACVRLSDDLLHIEEVLIQIHRQRQIVGDTLRHVVEQAALKSRMSPT